MSDDRLSVTLIGAEDTLAARVVAGLSAHASVAIAADTASADWARIELAIVVAKDASDGETVLRGTNDRPVLFVKSGGPGGEELWSLMGQATSSEARPAGVAPMRPGSPEANAGKQSLVASWDPAGADAELVAVIADLARRRAERAIDAATLAKLEDVLGAEEVAELLETYLQTTPALVATAAEALRDGDVRLLFSQAHQLKASSAAVGLPEVARAAAALEAAVTVEISEHAPGLLAELERQFRWACRGLLRRGG